MDVEKNSKAKSSQANSYVRMSQRRAEPKQVYTGSRCIFGLHGGVPFSLAELCTIKLD